MKRETSAVLIFMILSFFGTAAFRISIPAVSFFVRDVLKASMLGVGALTSAFFASRGITAILSGGATDKLKKRTLLISGAAFSLNAIVVSTFPYAHHIFFVIFLRLIQGVLNGFGWVPIQVFLGWSVQEKVRGRAYSLYFISGSIGGMAGNFIYSFISSATLLEMMIISSGFFAITSALVFSAYFLSREAERRIEKRGVEKRSSAKTFLLGILPIIVITFSGSIFSSVLRGGIIYVYLNEYLSMLKSEVAFWIGIAVAISLPVNFIISWISDKRSNVGALILALSLAILGGIFLSFPNITVAILGLILCSSGVSSVIPITRKLAVSVSKYEGASLGIINTSGNFGSVTGSSLAGYLFDLFGREMILGEMFVPTLIMILPLAISLGFALRLLKRP